jgi:hypothetical protein
MADDESLRWRDGLNWLLVTDIREGVGDQGTVAVLSAEGLVVLRQLTRDAGYGEDVEAYFNDLLAFCLGRGAHPTES